MRRTPPLLLSLLAACSLFQGNGQTVEPDYASNAQTNLKNGEDALHNLDYPVAEKYFDYVKTKYPFLEAAKEAELRLADVSFEKELWTEARDRYTSFVRLHPTHPKVDYAAFRAALTHYRDMPGDFFIIPPSTERDQREVKAAYDSLDAFVKTYPQSQYVPEARKRVEDTRQRLVKGEIYVANFYERRDHYLAAANRLENVVNLYPGADDAQAFFHLHDLYRKLKDEQKAKDALRRLVARMPGTPAAARAEKLLGS